MQSVDQALAGLSDAQRRNLRKLMRTLVETLGVDGGRAKAPVSDDT
jgi:hypothetical protein